MEALRGVQMRVVTRGQRSRQVRVRARLIHFTNFQIRRMVRVYFTIRTACHASPLGRHLHVSNFQGFMHLGSPTVLTGVQYSSYQGKLVPISSCSYSMLQVLFKNG